MIDFLELRQFNLKSELGSKTNTELISFHYGKSKDNEDKSNLCLYTVKINYLILWKQINFEEWENNRNCFWNEIKNKIYGENHLKNTLDFFSTELFEIFQYGNLATIEINIKYLFIKFYLFSIDIIYLLISELNQFFIYYSVYKLCVSFVNISLF